MICIPIGTYLFKQFDHNLLPCILKQSNSRYFVMLILHQSFNINFTLHQSKNLMKSRLFSKRNKNWPNAMFATILLNFRNLVNLKKRLSKDTSCGFMKANFNARPVITSMHLTKKSLLKCMTLQCSYAQTVCSRKTCLKFTEGNLVFHYIFSDLL